MPLPVDLSELPPGVIKKIHEVCTNEFTVQAQLAKIRQQRIAQFHHNHQGRGIEGLGGQEIAVDPWLLGYLQMHHQTSFWDDKEFREWMKKRLDFCRVKTGGTKIQSGYGGLSAGATKKKFSKKF
jgi:hypothetical protein